MKILNREFYKKIYSDIKLKNLFIGILIQRVYYKEIFNRIKKNIRGKNNFVSYKNSILSSVEFDILGNNNTINIKDSCLLRSVKFFIRGDNHVISISEGVKFNRGGMIWIEDYETSLEIGSNTTFEDIHLAVTEPGSKIVIGKDCLFAYDIDLRTGDSHSIFDLHTNERINYAEDVVISDRVWVGAHCVILKGSFIPKDSIIATGSIVTKKFFQEGSVIAGNPAKVVKEKIYWSRKRFY